MSMLKELRKYFEFQKLKQEKKLKQLEDSIKKLEQFKQHLQSNTLEQQILIDKLDLDLIENVRLLLIKNNNFSVKEIRNLQELLNQLKSQKLTFNVQSVLNEIKNIDFDIKQFAADINTVLLLLNANFTDENLKNHINQKYKELINKIEDLITNKMQELLKVIIPHLSIKLGQSYREKNDVNNYLSDLNFYLTLFDENKILEKFPTREMMNQFFDDIKRSELTEEEKLEVIKMFVKYNFQSYLEMKKKADSFVNSIVSTNKKNVHDLLVKKTSKSEVASSKESEKIIKEESDMLSGEAKVLYDELTKILDIHKEESNLDDIVISSLKNNFSVAARGDYIINGVANWNFIVSDIKTNLLPSVSTHTAEIKVILKYILDIKQKDEIRQKERDEFRKRIIKILNVINNILSENIDILDEYNKFDDTKQNFYNSIVNLINLKFDEEEIQQNIDNIFKSKNIIWFKKLMILLDLKEHVGLLKDYVDLAYISEDDKQMLIDIEKSVLKQQENLISLESLNEDITPSFETKNTDFEESKNLIIFSIKDDVSKYSEPFKKELENSIKKLRAQKWEDLRRHSHDHLIADIRYSTPSGEQKKYDESFEAFRLKNSHTTRTGVIKIKIHEKNAEKIRKRYTLKNDVTSLLIIFGVIGTSGEDHSNYKIFNKYIADNLKYLDYVAKLFNNPNADEDELFKIIDENCSLRLDSKQYGGK